MLQTQYFLLICFVTLTSLLYSSSSIENSNLYHHMQTQNLHVLTARSQFDNSHMDIADIGATDSNDSKSCNIFSRNIRAHSVVDMTTMTEEFNETVTAALQPNNILGNENCWTRGAWFWNGLNAIGNAASIGAFIYTFIFLNNQSKNMSMLCNCTSK